jgi:formylglycine-generating enzyme required for sulfatase activity
MRRVLSVVYLPLMLGLTLGGFPRELSAQQKARVPDAQAHEAARRVTDEIYGARFRQARRVAAKTALAAEMIDEALKVQNGSPDQYVVLKIAADIAAGTGDAPTALRAVERLIERFDVPSPRLIAETLLTAGGKASTSSQHKALGEAVLKVLDRVTGTEEFDLALRLCTLARSSAQKAGQYALAKELTAKTEDITNRQSALRECREARAVLDKNPHEPMANLTAGRYYCFVVGNWDRGLAMLALGSDAALKDVAIKDLRGAASAEEQAAIGDAWWAVAETKQGSERDALRLRAAAWYQQAETKLAGGLAVLKARQRLAEVRKLGREVPVLSRTPPPAIAPFDATTAKQHQAAWAKHLGVPVLQANSIEMRFALIPPGEFDMGSPKEEVGQLLEYAKARGAPSWYNDRVPAEAPRHRVRITRAFYLGVCEVTQAEYERVMGNNPSQCAGEATRPVEQVTWGDAAEFCRKLGELREERALRAVYRLPTEAEWEYACRAGTTTRFNFGEDEAGLGEHAWRAGNAQKQTQPVGRKLPNSFGLADMHGNVWEWCADWHAMDFYAKSPADDPVGPSSGLQRVFRGGSYLMSGGSHFRCAYRNSNSPGRRGPDLGFRVARVIAP